MTTLWPRVDAAVGETLLAEIRSSDLGQLTTRAATSHPAQRWASVGGSRADDEKLGAVRREMTAAAERHGYPDRGPDAERIAFDRELAVSLVDVMPMPVAEALDRAVWNFTTLVLAPDVTFWRFGTSNAERWICSDRTRHMFSRLWWQANQLTTRDGDVRVAALLQVFSESDLNQMLERTSIGGCRPLLMAFASALASLDESERSRGLIREAGLRLLRLTSVVDPYGLSEVQLAATVDRAVGDAVASLSAYPNAD